MNTRFKSLLSSFVLTLAVVGLTARAASRALGRYRSTWYRLALEQDYANEPRTLRLFDLKGHLIADVSAAFKKDLDLEGAGMLLDARVINYAGVIGGRSRYRTSRHPYGDGIGNCPLTPYRTIAVDPRTIPLGSVVRIRETIGMKLPDGTLHDGLWRAEDRGGAVKGHRVDLFVGVGKGAEKTLHEHGIRDVHWLTIDLVESPTRESCVRGH